MKNISNKNKIVLLVLILLIIAGTIILGVSGFEKSIEYQEGKRIEVYIPQGYEKHDIENIAKESFNQKKFIIEEVEKLNQVVGIRIKNYTKEELESLKTKVIEKYEIEEKELRVYEVELPSTRIRTDINPYIFPVFLVTILTSIYSLIRNMKLEEKWNILFKNILVLAIILGTYFSLILIFRIPFGVYTMPIALAIYIITLISVFNNKKQ